MSTLSALPWISTTPSPPKDIDSSTGLGGSSTAAGDAMPHLMPCLLYSIRPLTLLRYSLGANLVMEKHPNPTFYRCAIPMGSWCPARITRHTFEPQGEKYGEDVPAENASIRPLEPALSSPEKDCPPHVAECCHDSKLLNPTEMEMEMGLEMGIERCLRTRTESFNELGT